jgi:hypothetical protein
MGLLTDLDSNTRPVMRMPPKITTLFDRGAFERR